MNTDHGPYIGAVQDLLIRSGFNTLDEHAADHDPRGGAIQLDPHSPAAADWFAAWDEVWLGWTEDRGWVMACTEGVDRPEPRRFVFDLGVPRLATPVMAVSAVAEKTGASVSVKDGLPASDLVGACDFPDHTFEDDDPVFEQALAVYGAAL